MSRLHLSFEFFPPKNNEQVVVLADTRKELLACGPAYFSVTFGAGGSTLEHTVNTVKTIHAEDEVAVAPHLSCMGGGEDSIRLLLQDYVEAGVNRIVALRGDMPSGMASLGHFRYANELVEFIRSETGDHFNISVACYPEVHPEAESGRKDLENFKRKVESGADEAITQYFFNADAYLDFIERCGSAGIDIPVIPGIMPISNFTQLARFSEMCGADMPRWLRSRLRDYGDDRASIQSFGANFVSELCQRLIDQGVPGLHFYTLNRAKTTLRILENLGLST